jgi:hypothetical protein
VYFYPYRCIYSEVDKLCGAKIGPGDVYAHLKNKFRPKNI